MQLFFDVITENIDLIISTDPVRDDCPCPELVEKIKTPDKEFSDKFEEDIVNGIIWLYCDAENSLKYFRDAQKEKPEDETVLKIIHHIEDYLEKNSVDNHTTQNGSHL